MRDLEPKIWRRLQVPTDSSLQQLHQVLQVAFGWDNYHLSLFDVAGAHYSDPDPEWEVDIQDAATATLGKVAPWVGSVFTYIYDLGDHWEHEIVVEEIVEGQKGGFTCLDGERACPPEDCGGPPGYEEILKALAKGKGREHQETRRWVGKAFDPERFEIEAVNSALQLLIRPSSTP